MTEALKDAGEEGLEDFRGLQAIIETLLENQFPTRGDADDGDDADAEAAKAGAGGGGAASSSAAPKKPSKTPSTGVGAKRRLPSDDESSDDGASRLGHAGRPQTRALRQRRRTPFRPACCLARP